MFIDYNNRGEMRLGRLNDVELTNNPTTAADAGNGFVMNLGYTIVGNGWDFGATGARRDEDHPSGREKPGRIGSPDITGPSYEYIVFDNAKTTSYRADLSGGDSGQVSGDADRARAPGRPAGDDGRERLGVHVARTAIRLLPAGTAFRQSAIYEFTYTAKDPVVAGDRFGGDARFRCPFCGTRRRDRVNPLAGDVQHTFSYSISQPSRTLNDFQMLGFNEDEDGRRVIDGILSHTGGGSGDQINYRFAQTGRTERNRQNHLYPEGVFPFAHRC